MEKYAWKARVVKGKEAEYEKRHAEIWEEMKAVLKSAGIKNYTIWRVGEELFGYYECEKGIEYAAKIQRESEVVDEDAPQDDEKAGDQLLRKLLGPGDGVEHAS